MVISPWTIREGCLYVDRVIFVMSVGRFMNVFRAGLRLHLPALCIQQVIVRTFCILRCSRCGWLISTHCSRGARGETCRQPRTSNMHASKNVRACASSGMQYRRMWLISMGESMGLHACMSLLGVTTSVLREHDVGHFTELFRFRIDDR